jgi:hypothetical protein
MVRFAMSALGQKRTLMRLKPMSALPPKADLPQCRLDVRFGPCVDGSELARRIFTLQAWSVQPCVRPLSAVHMTAGHNALRGSGPGQNLAFNNAVAHVGCPDRRIDRLCITCCSPSPTFTSRHDTRRDLIRPSVRPDNCTARPKPSWPRPFGQACWQARWLRPWWVAA